MYHDFLTECDGRKYGENCSIPCGNCLLYEQCNPINGTCINGCDNGYQGLNCTEGIFFTSCNKQIVLNPESYIKMFPSSLNLK